MHKQWTIARGRVLGPSPFLLMGILNVTPDSFSDAARREKNTFLIPDDNRFELVPEEAPLENTGGVVMSMSGTLASAAAVDGMAALTASGLDMVKYGAGVLDLGGESTRPGAAPLRAAEECERVLPALAALQTAFAEFNPKQILSPLSQHELLSGVPTTRDDLPFLPAFSVDTFHADTARAVLEAGADIINDISAWSFEPELKEVLLEHKPGYVLMHCQGNPQDMQTKPHYYNVVEEVYAFLEGKLEELVKAGFPEDRVVIDPGIGFGKNLDHNLDLLGNIERFYALGRPVLLGISYKSFMGHLLDVPVGERGPLTQTASALMAERGVWAHRVHDVREVMLALHLAYYTSRQS